MQNFNRRHGLKLFTPPPDNERKSGTEYLPYKR